jgi:uncharacterized protein YpbB
MTPQEYAKSVTKNETYQNELIKAFEAGQKEAWNAAIDAAAEGAKILHKELNPAEDLGYTIKELATWECEYDHFEVSKQSILNLKK